MGAQDLLVAIVALGAAALVARRVVGFAARESSPKCANCAAGEPCAPGQPAAPASGSAPATHPLTLVRPPRP